MLLQIDDKLSVCSADSISKISGRCSPGRSTPIPSRSRTQGRVRDPVLDQQAPPSQPGGGWCHHCDDRLKELKRRAIKMWTLIMDSKARDNKVKHMKGSSYYQKHRHKHDLPL